MGYIQIQYSTRNSFRQFKRKYFHLICKNFKKIIIVVKFQSFPFQDLSMYAGTQDIPIELDVWHKDRYTLKVHKTYSESENLFPREKSLLLQAKTISPQLLDDLLSILNNNSSAVVMADKPLKISFFLTMTIFTLFPLCTLFLNAPRSNIRQLKQISVR